MQKTITFFTMFMFAFSGLFSAMGQEVEIKGEKFSVQSKTQLIKGVEYCKLVKKSSGTLRSKAQNYIKSGNNYSPTVLSEAELKNFLTNKTLSSLGKVSEITIGKKKHKYAAKKNASIFVIAGRDKLSVVEFLDDLGVSVFDNDPEAGMSDKEKSCRRRCELSNVDCCDDQFICEDSDNLMICLRELADCYKECRTAAAGGSGGFNTYVIGIKNFSIKY